eukprot:CAMPEP_0168494452 /NCGR_PEP_ID=MMETSP0228-20121227/71237_1 /TAXON_ID=133427 /ORGANISM="Protoceratium reticulatum, Strain CCCM 535 (=CCMP 1889)" /LENGTH=232 /DNA_ID=CAMNT_0008511257 /DNA_START=67 /DNA_END=761 /DNA_ORIENTATION=-
MACSMGDASSAGPPCCAGEARRPPPTQFWRDARKVTYQNEAICRVEGKWSSRQRGIERGVQDHASWSGALARHAGINAPVISWRSAGFEELAPQRSAAAPLATECAATLRRSVGCGRRRLRNAQGPRPSGQCRQPKLGASPSAAAEEGHAALLDSMHAEPGLSPAVVPPTPQGPIPCLALDLEERGALLPLPTALNALHEHGAELVPVLGAVPLELEAPGLEGHHQGLGGPP